MIDAASPRASENETSVRMGNGPRTVGYVLVS